MFDLLGRNLGIPPSTIKRAVVATLFVFGLLAFNKAITGKYYYSFAKISNYFKPNLIKEKPDATDKKTTVEEGNLHK